jgi:hypothetical protein
VAAWLVRHADASVLGVAVGALLLVTNARTIMLELDVHGQLRLPVLLAIGAAGLAVARHVRLTHRRAGAGRQVPDQAVAPVVVDAGTPSVAAPRPAEAVRAETVRAEAMTVAAEVARD